MFISSGVYSFLDTRKLEVAFNYRDHQTGRGGGGGGGGGGGKPDG